MGANPIESKREKEILDPNLCESFSYPLQYYSNWSLLSRLIKTSATRKLYFVLSP